MALHQEAVKLNPATTGETFQLTLGGLYAVDVQGANYGTVKIQKLAPDGTTLLDMKFAVDNGGTEQDDVYSTFAANGSKLMYLSPGGYTVTIASATSVKVTVTRVSVE